MLDAPKSSRPALFAAILLAGRGAVAQAPLGIPRELARARAQRLHDVRYRLGFALMPTADSVAGREQLRFVRRGAESEWLDFREGGIRRLTINGHAAATTIQNGHVKLPAPLLQAGENLVEIEFSAPIALAGKALTRFEDVDDGSEYIYTVFVPMDAEMAFPCFDQPDLKARFQLTLTVPQDWTKISNTTEVKNGAAPQQLEFAETKPISTYLFAFAAGPFQKVSDTSRLPGVYIRKSKAQKAPAAARLGCDRAARRVEWREHRVRDLAGGLSALRLRQ